MFKSNIENNRVFLELANVLKQDLTDDLVVVANKTINRIKSRISLGIKTDGGTMITKSSKRTGLYSEKYGKKRQESGLQTGRVDLQFDGTTMGAFGIIEQGNGRVVGGFETDKAAEIAGYNELYFGAAYVPSEQETNKAGDEFFEIISKKIRNV